MIIGLGHYSRVGKDTLANFIIEQGAKCGINVQKRSFAWGMKKVAHDLYGWAGLREPGFYEGEGQTLRNTKLSELGMTPVELWVALGTHAIRDNVYRDTWVEYLLHKAPACDVLVISDVRFPNEIDALRKRGARLIKVVRPGCKPKDTVADRALATYTRWDFTTGKSGSLSELQACAKTLIGDYQCQTCR